MTHRAKKFIITKELLASLIAGKSQAAADVPIDMDIFYCAWSPELLGLVIFASHPSFPESDVTADLPVSLVEYRKVTS